MLSVRIKGDWYSKMFTSKLQSYPLQFEDSGYCLGHFEIYWVSCESGLIPLVRPRKPHSSLNPQHLSNWRRASSKPTVKKVSSLGGFISLIACVYHPPPKCFTEEREDVISASITCRTFSLYEGSPLCGFLNIGGQSWSWSSFHPQSKSLLSFLWDYLWLPPWLKLFLQDFLWLWSLRWQ